MYERQILKEEALADDFCQGIRFLYAIKCVICFKCRSFIGKFLRLIIFLFCGKLLSFIFFFKLRNRLSSLFFEETH